MGKVVREWFDLSQPVGSTYQFSHGEACLEYGEATPDTRSRFYVTRKNDGWLYYCHNCGCKGFRRLDGAPPAEVKRMVQAKLDAGLRVQHTMVEKDITLPPDFSQNMPQEASKWILRYITHEEARKARVGYSRMKQRVILPCYVGDKLVLYQGRWLGTPSKKNPKYLTWTNGTRKHLYWVNPMSRSVCVVEDMLSAIVVGRRVAGLAVLGSYIGTDVIEAVRGYEHIYVWLDYDKKHKTLEYAQRLRQMSGLAVTPVVTIEDPKDNGDNLDEIFGGDL